MPNRLAQNGRYENSGLGVALMVSVDASVTGDGEGWTDADIRVESLACAVGNGKNSPSVGPGNRHGWKFMQNSRGSGPKGRAGPVGHGATTRGWTLALALGRLQG